MGTTRNVSRPAITNHKEIDAVLVVSLVVWKFVFSVSMPEKFLL